MTPTVGHARMARNAAKARLSATASAAGRKLNPRTLAQEAVEGARDKAVRMANETATTVRRHPAVVVAVIAAIGAVFARHRIVRGRHRVHDEAAAPSQFPYPAERALGPVKGYQP